MERTSERRKRRKRNGHGIDGNVSHTVDGGVVREKKKKEKGGKAEKARTEDEATESVARRMIGRCARTGDSDWAKKEERGMEKRQRRMDVGRGRGNGGKTARGNIATRRE